jgi:HK97 family phage prohead protease
MALRPWPRIRAAKGKVEDPSELKFKEGDRLGFIVPAETTDKLLIFASDGRFFTVDCSKLPSARGHGEPLRLKVDKKGLRYEVDLPDTAQARDVRELIRRGDVSGSSFGFVVQGDEWDESQMKSGKLPLRTLTKLELFDVSPVTYPAYPQTSVSARSKAQTLAESGQVALRQRMAARVAIERAKAWR